MTSMIRLAGTWATRATGTGVTAVFPRTTVQTCIINLVRNTFRYASCKNWDQISRGLKPIYPAPTIAAAETARDDFLDSWARVYPAIPTLWMNAWTEFAPFLDYDLEISRVPARGTRSSHGTPGSAARSEPAGTSRPSRQR
jgi:transposase-like protein